MESLDEKRLRAKQLYKAELFQEAAIAFEEVAHSFYQNREMVQAAEEKNNSSVAYLKSGNAQKAYELAQYTDEIFEEAHDLKRQAIALGNQAAALQELGQLSDALGLYQQCNEILSELSENEMRVYVLQNISAIQMRMGNQLEALASAQAALANKPKKTIPEKILSWLNRFTRI